MKNSLKKVFASLFAGLLILSACGGGSGTVDTKFPMEVSNNGKGIDTAVLKYGIVTDSALPGIYNRAFYSAAIDNEVLQFVLPSLYHYTEDFEIDTEKPGLASIKIAEDLLSVEVKLDENLNWDDGQPVTAEDYAFAFEVIGRKDYAAEKGIRYTNSIPLIEGMEAYHEGNTDTISGLKIVDEKTLKVTFTEPTLSIKADFWGYPLPKHLFEGMTAKQILASEYSRTKIVGYGPFSVEKVIPGESVKLVRNESYALDKAKMAGIEVKAVQPASVDEAISSGEVDMLDRFPEDKYEPAAIPENTEVIGNMMNAYTYIGFKLGHWSNDKSENIVNPDAKMSDVNLRQAMMLAMDTASVGENLYKGLRVPATSIIPPTFKNYHDPEVKGYAFDPEAANKLLDDAGYVDVDGDGFRETPEGKPLVINFAAMSTEQVAEPRANFYIQNWKDIGINVQLLDGRLQDFNAFYDKVQEDDPAVDIYEAGWQTGFDQNPASLWGPKSFSNFTRFQSPEGNQIIDNISSEKAIFDEEYRKEQYNDWQEYFQEAVPARPTLYRYRISLVNKRVKNYTIAPGKAEDGMLWADVELTEDQPIKA